MRKAEKRKPVAERIRSDKKEKWKLFLQNKKNPGGEKALFFFFSFFSFRLQKGSKKKCVGVFKILKPTSYKGLSCALFAHFCALFRTKRLLRTFFEVK